MEVKATVRSAGVDRRPDLRASTTVPLTRASRGATVRPRMTMGSEIVPSNESPERAVPLSIVVPRITCISVPAGIVTGLGPSIRLSRPPDFAPADPELSPLEDEALPGFALFPLFAQPGRHRAAATMRESNTNE